MTWQNQSASVGMQNEHFVSFSHDQSEVMQWLVREESPRFPNTLFFYIRTSNFGAEVERSYFFHDLRLKMFLRRS